MRFKTTIEIEVEVECTVERTVRPSGFDPGDPGGMELARVELTRFVTLSPEEAGDSGRLTRPITVDLFDYLPADTLATLEELADEEARTQAEDRAIAAAEARRDAEEDR
jgi:hypothetical protein